MDYLAMSGVEYAALVRLSEPDDVASIQLSRRDSFDAPHASGFLVASVVPTDGEQFRIAIGETGSLTDWGRS